MSSKSSAKRRRGRPSWAGTKNALAAELPPGPCSAEELGRWPEHMLMALRRSGRTEDTEMALRLKTIYNTGIDIYTEYSGVDCPREAMFLALEGAVGCLGGTSRSTR